MHQDDDRRAIPRSVIIWTRSLALSLKLRYHRTHSTMISWSKCRPLKRFGDGVVISPLSQCADPFHRLHQNPQKYGVKLWEDSSGCLRLITRCPELCVCQIPSSA